MKSVNIQLALLMALGLFLAACGGNDANSAGESGAATEQMEAHHDHDHDHSGEATDAAAQGKEYTSAYVCPMHCKGSGSEEPGKCPVCGMDYVARADQEAESHNHDDM